MTNEEILEAAKKYHSALLALDALPERNIEAATPMARRRHMTWMCEEISAMVATGDTSAKQREKIMRWLGFLQGALWMDELSSIEDLKKDNAGGKAGPPFLTTEYQAALTLDQQAMQEVQELEDRKAFGYSAKKVATVAFGHTKPTDVIHFFSRYVHYKGGFYTPVLAGRNSENLAEWLIGYISHTTGDGCIRPWNTLGEDSWSDLVVWKDGVTRARFLPAHQFNADMLVEKAQ